MAHNIIAGLDAGILEGTEPTWHGMPEYKLVGDKPITMAEVIKLIDYDVRIVPLYFEDGGKFVKLPTGQAICRVKPDGGLHPLCRAVGRKYSVLPRKELLNTFDEHLLCRFPQLKIAGAGTFGGGQTFFIQLRVEDYHIKGDKSDHQLRLSYSDSYGETSHRVFVTGVRVVCNNTLRFAVADAEARKMFSSIRHTAGAVAVIEGQMELFAKLHLQLQDEIEKLERLTSLDTDGKYVDSFLEEMFPLPKDPEKHAVTVNRMNAARSKVREIFDTSSDTMDNSIANSRYALLQAFTDTVDHHVYSRTPGRRWQQAQSGLGALLKTQAVEFLSV